MTTPDRKPDTIVLVHGLWMTPLSWEHWIKHFEDAGYTVHAPAWPGVEGDIDALRKDPSVLNGLGVREIADHYEKFIKALPNRPIIMGHSFGGAVTQILLDRGLGAAGVAIDSGPIKGVLGLPFSALRVASAALRNPFNLKRTVALTPQQFHYAFGNALSFEDSENVRNYYAIPGPGRPLFQAAFANFNPKAATKVNFKNSTRAPLLLIAGGDDHVVPASMNRENFKRYRKSAAVTAFKEFPGRTHYTVGQDGWPEVADYALSWSLENAR